MPCNYRPQKNVGIIDLDRSMRLLLIAQREKKAIFIGERIFLFSKICNLFQGSKLFWKIMNEHEVISKENKLLLYIQVRKI